MQEEILQYLLDNDIQSFIKNLSDFLEKEVSVENLVEYSFLPSMFDSWLISAKENLDFDLHKLFQNGELAYDLSTYIIVPKKGNSAYVITLNNVYHRDQQAKNEIIKRYKHKQLLRQKVNVESDIDIYGSIIKRHNNFLDSKLVGSNSNERYAKATWLLAQDNIHSALDNIANSKYVKYVAIVNIKGHINILAMDNNLANVRKIYKNINDARQSHNIINEIKNSLYIKNDRIQYRALESLKLSSKETVNRKNSDILFDKNFKKKLEYILEFSKKNVGLPKRKLANLHGAVIGFLLNHRRDLTLGINLGDFISPSQRLIIIYPKRKKVANLLTLTLAEVNRFQLMNIDTFEKIDLKQYKFVFEHYNILRIEQVSIVASKFNNEVLISKKIPTIALPEKNKRSLTDLLATGNFNAFTHNLNLFTESIIDINSVNKKFSEFFPGFFLSILFEGLLQNKLIFYTQLSDSYEHYDFLIDSVLENRIILLTNAKKQDQISSIINIIYNDKINLIASKKNIPAIDILQIDASQGALTIRTFQRNIEPIFGFQYPELISFSNANIVAETSFSDLLKNIIYKKDSINYANALNEFIKTLILKNGEIIFTNKPNKKAYIAGGLMGFIAASWKNLYAIESDGMFGKDEYPYLCVTPNAFPTKRKVNEEMNPRSLVFNFKWSEATTLNLENSINLVNSELSKFQIKKLNALKSQAFHYREAIPITIVASKTNILTYIQPKPINNIFYYSSDGLEQSNDIEEYKPSTKKCRTKRAKNAINTGQCADKNKIKDALKEIIFFSNTHAHLADIEDQIHAKLVAQGLDENLINVLKSKISTEYDTLGDVFLKNQYDYLTGDKEEQYLRKHEENIKFKIKKWFSITIFYSLLDSVISIRQSNEIFPIVLSLMDTTEGMLIFSGQSFAEFKVTRKLGLFLKEVAANPVLSLASYFGSIVQFGHGAYSLSTGGHTNPVNYYWTLRGLQQCLSVFSVFLKKMHFGLVFYDILISSISHISASRAVVYNFARFLPLKDSERYEIGFKYFFAMDLSDYERKIGFKQKLTSMYEYFKENLDETGCRAVVFFADTMVVRRISAQGNVGIIRYPVNTTLDTTYHLNLQDNQPDTVSNLTNFSVERFLPSHKAYLGLSSDAKRCLYHYQRLCLIQKSVSITNQIEYATRASLGRHILTVNCQLRNGSSPTGDGCQKYDQIVYDTMERSVSVVDGADLMMPTIPQREKRFAWVSMPLGDMHLQKKECRYLSVHTQEYLYFLKFQTDKTECNQSFAFVNSHPFILSDKRKPMNGSVLYLNAPKKMVGNKKISHLQTMPNNPSIIYVADENVAYNGSSNFQNYFILHSNSQFFGYVRGGNAVDLLQTSDSVKGELSLRFVDKFTTPINNTLIAIQIEHYLGSDTVSEDVLIDYCGLTTINAKGSQGKGDMFKVDETLRCNATNKELRIVYPGDIHYVGNHKPVIFQLNSTEFNKPAFLIQADNFTVTFPQIVLLNVSLANVKISKLSFIEENLVLNGYEVTTHQGFNLLKSNAYKNTVYITQEGIELSLKSRILDELKQLIILQKHAINHTIAGWEPINSETLNNINIFAEYNNTAYNNTALPSLIDQYFNSLIFPWQLQRFTIYDYPVAHFQIGSVYNDEFLTTREYVQYVFMGGEGTDFYRILPKAIADSRFIERVLIDNKAYIYNDYFGQDILDLSSFEYLQPALSVVDVTREDKVIFNLFNLDANTLVLLVTYDSSVNKKNKLKIYLKNYLVNEDFRHLYVRLSSYPEADILYRIDVDSKELIPFTYPQQAGVNVTENHMPHTVKMFPTLSLKSNLIAQHKYIALQQSSIKPLRTYNRALQNFPTDFQSSRFKDKNFSLGYELTRLHSVMNFNLPSRAINPGDVYVVDPELRSITLSLNSTLSEKIPFILVRVMVETHARQLLHLKNMPFVNISMRKIRRPEAILPGGAYEITRYGAQHALVKTNAYESVVFLTEDNIRFYLEPKTNEDRRHIVKQNELCETLHRADCESTEINPLQDPKIVAFFHVNETVSSLQDLNTLEHRFTENHLKSSIRYFIIESNDYNFEFGSNYDDQFLTKYENTDYRFTGREGNDIYKVLPGDNTLYRIFINNEAFFYDKHYGQDILDLSAFEYFKIYYQSFIYLANFDDFEKSQPYLNNYSIVLKISYTDSSAQKYKQVRICLENYLLNEDFRHIFIKLSRYSNLFYRINYDSKQLIPVRYHSISKANYEHDNSSFHATIDTDVSTNNKTAVSQLLIHQQLILEPRVNKINQSYAENEVYRLRDYFLNDTVFAVLSSSVGLLSGVLFMLHRRRAPGVYSPVPTQLVATTITAAANLVNTVDAVYSSLSTHTIETAETVEQALFYEKSGLLESNKIGLAFHSSHTRNLSLSAEIGTHFFSLASIISEHYRTKRIKKFIKKDIARNVSISRIQEQQIRHEHGYLMHGFFKGISKFIKYDPVNNKQCITNNFNEDKLTVFLDKFLPKKKQKNVIKRLEAHMESMESMNEIENAFSEFFLDIACKKIKQAKFSKVPELAEKQKTAMLFALPVTFFTEDEVMRSLGMANQKNILLMCTRVCRQLSYRITV